MITLSFILGLQREVHQHAIMSCQYQYRLTMLRDPLSKDDPN